MTYNVKSRASSNEKKWKRLSEGECASDFLKERERCPGEEMGEGEYKTRRSRK